MTEQRPDTGALLHALVHEKGGGPTMFVVGFTVSENGVFVHCKWKDAMNEEAVATFRGEDLEIVVPFTAEGDR